MGSLVQLSVLLALSVNYVLFTKAQNMLKKEAYLSVPALIASKGYPVEKHRARTSDGYTLQLHRIPAGRGERGARGARGRRAVLLVHGLLGSSGDFVIMGPDRSLSYVLADAGYDVWLANLRGNIYTTHQNLTRQDEQFWNYSFHEHGKYDLPAIIDKILNVTGLQKILYIGYSMGTTSFFTMMSERPEYNDKIYAFIALAPAVYLNNIKTIAEIALKTLNLPSALRSNGVKSLHMQQGVMDALIVSMCSARRPQQDICMRVAYSIVGEDYEQTDWDITPIILARFQPASLKQLEHFGKIAMTGVFTSFEDPVKPYKLDNVKIPVTLFYGENDQLTEKSQVMRLARDLNTTGMLDDVRPACAWPKFNHLDFVFAKDVGEMFSKPLVATVDDVYNKYAPK